MIFGELWGVVLGTSLALAMVIGLFILKRVLRRHLFPDPSDSSRDRAMWELLQLQTRLQERPSTPEIGGSDAAEQGGGDSAG